MNISFLFFSQSVEVVELHQLQLCKEVRLPTTTNEHPGYDTKKSDAGVPVMLDLWGMQNTLPLPLLLGPLWPGVVAPDRILSMGQTELNCVLVLN